MGLDSWKIVELNQRSDEKIDRKSLAENFEKVHRSLDWPFHQLSHDVCSISRLKWLTFQRTSSQKTGIFRLNFSCLFFHQLQIAKKHVQNPRQSFNVNINRLLITLRGLRSRQKSTKITLTKHKNKRTKVRSKIESIVRHHNAIIIKLILRNLKIQHLHELKEKYDKKIPEKKDRKISTWWFMIMISYTATHNYYEYWRFRTF